MKRRRGDGPGLKLRPFNAAASAKDSNDGARRRVPEPARCAAGAGFARASELAVVVEGKNRHELHNYVRIHDSNRDSATTVGGAGRLRLSGAFSRASDVDRSSGGAFKRHSSERAFSNSAEFSEAFEHPAVIVGMANYESAWRRAPADAAVSFTREPENEHDQHAIAATMDGERIGYLPRKIAFAVSSFVDTGGVSLQTVHLSIEQHESLTAPSAPAPSAFAVTLRLACRASALAALRGRLGVDASGVDADTTGTDELGTASLPPTLRSVHSAATPGLAVLSLFSGISADLLALRRARIPCRLYASSEVDPKANAVVANLLAKDAVLQNTKHVELGDVRQLNETYLCKLATEGQIDLLIGGSPCQDLSRMAGPDRQGLKGPSSCLFWEYVRVLTAVKKVRPSIVFVLENVYGMPEVDRDTITEALGVTPVRMRACEISACKRDRYFWSNLPARGLRLPSAANLPNFADCLVSVRLRCSTLASLLFLSPHSQGCV